jgi:FkbM family methyltransferase
MNHYKYIKDWDDNYCEKHIINLCNHISQIFKLKNIFTIKYIDIGANVGKVYDILSQKIKIEEAHLFEASPILYNYISNKFKDKSFVYTYNYAIYKDERMVSIDESSMIYQMLQSEYNDLNFGLSKISNFTNGNVKAIPISSFLNDNYLLYEDINFIKIDTENVDLEILEDILTIINNFKIKPIIEFEKNYFINGHTDDDCQFVLDKFIPYGYKPIDIKVCTGDGILIPDYLE